MEPVSQRAPCITRGLPKACAAALNAARALVHGGQQRAHARLTAYRRRGPSGGQPDRRSPERQAFGAELTDFLGALGLEPMLVRDLTTEMAAGCGAPTGRASAN
jgi:hypothetical protein